MKQLHWIHRVLAGIVCLCMLTGLMPEITAQAQESAALPDGSLQDASGWIYRVLENGEAEVLGHTDTSVQALTIPQNLGEKWVTAVGENAFADNPALKTLRAPASVTVWASSAFPAHSQLTISAYHGAAALSYARERGFEAHSLSAYDFLTDVVDLSDMKASQFSLVNDTTLSLGAPFAALVTPGAKLYLPPFGAYMQGYAVQVESVTSTGANVVAHVSELPFTQTVASYSAEDVELYMDMSSFVPASGVTVLPTSRASVSATGSLPLNLQVEQQYGENFQLSCTIGLSATCSVTVEYENFDFQRVDLDHTFSVSASLNGKGTREKEFPLGTYTLVSNGLISGNVKLQMKASLTGEITVTAELTETFSTRWKPSTGLSKTHSAPASISSLKAKSTAEVGVVPQISISLGFAKAKVDLIWVDLFLGFYGEGEYSTLSPYCMDIRGGVRASASIAIGLKTQTASYLLASSEIASLRVELLYWHLEGLEQKFQTECTYADTCTITFITGGGDPLAPLQVPVGSNLYSLPTPTRDGYRFTHWYTDPELTQLFDTTSAITHKAITLYAEWIYDGSTATPAPAFTPQPTPSPAGATPLPENTPEPTGRPTHWPTYNNKDAAPLSLYGGEFVSVTATSFGEIHESGDYLASHTCPEYSSALRCSVIGYVQDGGLHIKGYHLCHPNPPEDSDLDTTAPPTFYYITIPPVINDIPVVSVSFQSGSVFDYINDPDYIYALHLPSNLESVELNCPALRTLSVGANVKEITLNTPYLEALSLHNAGAINLEGDMNNLSSITLTNDTAEQTSLYNAFNYAMPSLRTVSLENISVAALGNCLPSLQSVSLTNCTVSDSFNECPNLSSVSITGESSFTYAFNDLTSGVSFSVPQNAYVYRSFNGYKVSDQQTIELAQFDRWTFDQTPLHVIVPKSTYEYADFANWRNLVSVTFEGGTGRIVSDAFFNCDSLTSVKLPGDLELSAKDRTLADENGRPYANNNMFTLCSGVKLTVGHGSDYIEADYAQQFSPFPNSPLGDVTATLAPTVLSISNHAFTGWNAFKGALALPASILTISEGAFQSCPNITSVTLPSTIEYIGEGAFMSCDSLESVTLSSGPMISFDRKAFASNNALKTVHMPVNLPANTYYTFAQCSNLETVTFGSSVTAIPDYTFQGSSGLKQITFPDGLKTIGHYAFYQGNLERVSLPSGIESVGNYAFAHCENLKEIDLPSSIDPLGEGVFYGNKTITEFTVPSGWTTLPVGMCGGWEKLNTIHWNNSLTTISEDAFFDCNALTSISLPSTITDIGKRAFGSCDNLREVTLNEGLKRIAESAFMSVDLPSLVLPASLESVGTDAFTGSIATLTVLCNQLTFDDNFFFWPWSEGQMIVYAAQESTVAQYLMANHPQISVVPVGSEQYSVTFLMNNDDAEQPIFHVDMSYSGLKISRPDQPSLNNYMFLDWYKDRDCTQAWDFAADVMPDDNLVLYAGWEAVTNSEWESVEGGVNLSNLSGSGAQIILPAEVNGLPVLGLTAGSVDATVQSLHLPASLETIDENAFIDALSLTAITVDAQNTSFYAVDGVLFGADGTLLHYPAARAGEHYTTPDGTTAIASRAFVTTSNLVSLTLSAGVTTLHETALASGHTITAVHFTADPVSIHTWAINDVSSIAITGPDEAPVLDAYLETHGILRGIHTLTLLSDGYVRLLYSLAPGELVPTDLLPETGTETLDSILLGWSETGSAEDLWDLDSDTMPDADLTLTAVWGDRFDWELIDEASDAIRLTRYNGTSRTIEITDPYKGLRIREIAPDCFGDTADLTLTGLPADLLEEFVETNGGTYVPLHSTLRFDTQCAITLDPIQVPIGSAVTLPTPQRYGYSFYYWLCDGVIYDADTPLYADAKEFLLQAVWLPDSSATAPEGLFLYQITDAGAVITGITEELSALAVPDTLGGQPVVEIADYAFDGLGIRSVTLPDSLLRIGRYAFQSCSYLQSIALPDALSELGEGAFFGCGLLSEIALPAALERVNAHTFAHCGTLTGVSIPAGLSEITPSAFSGCTNLAAYTVASGNVYYSSADGVLYSADGTRLMLYPAGKTDSSFAVPEGVQSIEAGAMSGSSIAQLTLPSTLFFIGNGAFQRSNQLTAVIFPESGDISIGDSAFSGCISLTQVTLPHSVWSVGDGAFTLCPLTRVDVERADIILADRAFDAASTLTLYGPADSTACAWALSNGVTYISPDSVQPEFITMDDVYVALGHTLTLTPIFSPADTTVTGVRWEIGDKSIATIDAGGVLTAWAAGETLVTVYGANNCVDSFTVTVYRNPADVQTLVLSSTELTIAPGESCMLSAVIEPFGDDEITWSSSNETVAVYDSDTVSVVALSEGNAFILASTQSGLNAVCLVTVGTAASGGLGISAALLELTVGEGLEISAWVEDDPDSTEEILWKSSDESIAWYDLTSGMVFGGRAGTAILTAYTQSGLSAECMVVVRNAEESLSLPYNYIELGEGWYVDMWIESMPSTSTTVSWESPDPDIAYFSEADGRIYGVSKGTTTLRAFTDDGYEATCEVVVQIWGEAYLPAGLTTLDEEAFSGCYFYYVDCPNGLETIGPRAFAGSPLLTEIYIPASVTSIADDAFTGCSSLYWIDGYTGTAAETFANEHGYAFNALD